MLIIARTLRELSFSSLMEVYEEGNRENAAARWPDAPEERALQLAEDEFYHYLREVFFTTAHACYAVWSENGEYVSALRLEPYRDGMLLAALETAPDHRKKGYAEQLVSSVISRFGGKIYSHVLKSNVLSLQLHKKCGFRRISEHAIYIDGSVNSKACTLCYDA